MYYIDAKIASGCFPNTTQLAREYEVSNATISRDIEFMRDQLDAPIEYDFLHRGYYYSKKTFRLPAGFATSRDALALGMVKSLLSMYRKTPLYPMAQHLMESLCAPLGKSENGNWVNERIVVPPLPGSEVKQETWSLIINALRENRVITFDYSGIWNRETSRRRVRPYQLIFDGGVWYLYGYAEERNDVRVFNLTRMTKLVLTEDKFTLPADFSYGAHSDDSYFGVFVGGHKERYRIACYEESAVWVQERKWAADQKIQKKDGSLIISFSSTQYEKVMAWLMSQGPNAEPLEPEYLVKDWAREIRAMAKMARGK
jgi:predicted DNA-binding transcriptional regulator YafY